MDKALEHPRKQNSTDSSASSAFLLAAMTWSVFGQTLRHDFINYDDPDYILTNPEITKGLTLHGMAWVFTHRVSHNWHPLTMITHMLDCQLYGKQAGGHHSTNVILHTLTSVLLFLVLRKMTGALWPSGFIAALFAIHPLRAESVAWVAERKDVLSGLFFVLTLHAYVRYAGKPSSRNYLLVVVVFALGLMAKPMLVTLPLVLLLLDYWPLNRVRKSEVRSQNSKIETGNFETQSSIKLFLEKVPLLFLSLVSCVITLIAQKQALDPMEIAPIPVRIYNACVSFIVYIRELFWPSGLALHYPYPSGTLSGWIGLAALATLITVTAMAWARRKQWPYLFTGWLWYVIMLLPVIGLVQVGLQARADRYTYLPHIGLYLAITWLVLALSKQWPYRQEILTATGTAVVGLLAATAHNQTSYWKNSRTIWTRTLAVTSNNAIAHQSLGYRLLEDREFDAAMSHLQAAIKIWPDYGNSKTNLQNAPVHYAMGRVLTETGHVRESISQYEKALTLRPNDAVVHDELGRALARDGQMENAIAHWEKSLAIAPRRVPTLNDVALYLATCSDARYRNGTRAVQLAQLADQLSSGTDPVIVRTLAAAYAEEGRFDRAINEAERALKLARAQSNSPLANNLGFDIDLYRMNFPRRQWDSASALYK